MRQRVQTFIEDGVAHEIGCRRATTGVPDACPQDRGRETGLSESAFMRHPKSHDPLSVPLGWFVAISDFGAGGPEPGVLNNRFVAAQRLSTFWERIERSGCVTRHLSIAPRRPTASAINEWPTILRDAEPIKNESTRTPDVKKARGGEANSQHGRCRYDSGRLDFDI